VGLWEFSGQCDADAAGCVYATAIDGSMQECHLFLPQNSLVRVTNVANVVSFWVDGNYRLSPDDKLFVAHELAFKYNAGRWWWYNSNSWNWKVCHVDARCDDGLPLEPASCPEELNYQSILSIPNCQGSSPGERCIANKDECGIPIDLKNCKNGYYSSGYSSEYKVDLYSVYEKALGSTRTITTSTTATVPFVFMVDDGPCAIQHGCVRSPGFPHADLTNQSCQISLSPAADLRLVEFRNCGSSSHSLRVGDRIFTYFPSYYPSRRRRVVAHHASSIQWQPGDSNAAWQVCLTWAEASSTSSWSTCDETSDHPGVETSDDSWVAWVLSVLAILFIACLVASIVYLSREKKDNKRSTASSHEVPQGVTSGMESKVTGIAATYLLNDFGELARERVEVESPNFYDLTVLSYGPTGLGYQKRCPRDGQLGCSIVDAINECYRGEASYFVSWCWQYKLNDFVSAISSWVQREGVDRSDAYLWVCFFCNNQYRILEEQTQHGSSQLTSMFEHHLASTGRMLILLDSFTPAPLFLTRAWCLFECYVSADQYIPMTITFPDRLRTEGTEGRRPLEEAIQALDMRRAKASDKVDEEVIKNLIVASVGFDEFNATCRQRLLESLEVLDTDLSWRTL